MSDNLKKSKEIKVPDVYKEQNSIPDYSYGQSQEGLDLRRQRNGGFGIRQTMANNTVYYATTSGLVTGNSGGSNSVTIEGYVGDTSTPSTLVAQASTSTAVAVTQSNFICFPVQKGEYYKINSSTGLLNGYFTPVY